MLRNYAYLNIVPTSIITEYITDNEDCIKRFVTT